MDLKKPLADVPYLAYTKLWASWPTPEGRKRKKARRGRKGEEERGGRRNGCGRVTEKMRGSLSTNEQAQSADPAGETQR